MLDGKPLLSGNMTCSNPDCKAVSPTHYGYEVTELADRITNAAEDIIMEANAIAALEEKLGGLLSYVTGGRFSKTSYSLAEMKSFADDWRKVECAECDMTRAESAAEAAKPLTLEELNAISAEEGNIVFIEYRTQDYLTGCCGWAEIEKSNQSYTIYRPGSGITDFVSAGGYAKLWRGWKNKPMPEEMEAAPWD